MTKLPPPRMRDGSSGRCAVASSAMGTGSATAVGKPPVMTNVTIQDVIAVEGPRLPDVDHAQKKFNTGMVVIVEHGKTPSKELIDRANAVARAWIDYWVTTTGHRASMTTIPR